MLGMLDAYVSELVAFKLVSDWTLVQIYLSFYR